MCPLFGAFSHGLLITETVARGDTVLQQIQDLGKHVRCPLAAEGKRVHLASKVKLKSGQISFFPRLRRPYFLSGVSGSFYIFLDLF